MGLLLALLLPLLLTGGERLAAAAYGDLRLAQNLIAGRGSFFDAGAGGLVPDWPAPLPWLLLALLGRAGAPPAPIAWLLGAVGWSMAGVSLHLLYRQRPFAGWLAPLLLILYPLGDLTAGTAVGWALAWLHLSQLAARRQQWRQHTLFLTLFLSVQFTPAALAVAALLWGQQTAAHRGRRKKATVRGLLLLTAVLLWGGWLFRGGSLPGFTGMDAWPAVLRALWPDWDLLWLAAPLVAAGIWAVWRQRERAWLPALAGLWWAVSVILGLFPVAALTGYLVLLLAGWGLDWLATRPLFVSAPRGVWVMAAAVLLLPAVAAYWIDGRAPVVPDEAAAWLRDNSPETAVVLGPAALTYEADRPRHPLSDRVAPDNPLRPERAPAFAPDLLLASPDFVAASSGLAWELITTLDGFRRRYRPVITDTTGLILWARHAPPGEYARQPLDVAAERGVNLVGYRYGPARLTPGEAVDVTLYLKAAQPLSRTFQTVVRLVSPLDGEAFAQRDETTPLSIPLDWWQPGQTVAEHFVLTTTADLPVGAYQLNVSLHAHSSDRFWAMYQGGDVNVLDRVSLGFVANPGPPPGVERPIDAVFGQQVVLHGVTMPETAVAAESVPVTLSWGAVRTPDDDYVAFVHLLGEDGTWVTGNDAEPLNGRFPTRALQPGDRIGDRRTLALPPDLAPGTYLVKAGLYLPETGTRLPAVDAAGAPRPDGSVLLGRIEVTQ